MRPGHDLDRCDGGGGMIDNVSEPRPKIPEDGGPYSLYLDGVLCSAPESFGTTAQRPSDPLMAEPYFDTTLGLMIVWNGTAWSDFAGNTV